MSLRRFLGGLAVVFATAHLVMVWRWARQEAVKIRIFLETIEVDEPTIVDPPPDELTRFAHEVFEWDPEWIQAEIDRLGGGV